MTVLAQAGALAKAGRMGEAVALVTRAAKGGDAEACMALGHWRLFGPYLPVDAAEAYRWFGQAANAGSLEAQRIGAYMRAAGVGTRADPDAAAQALLAAQGADPTIRRMAEVAAALDDAPPPAIEDLSPDPLVRAFRAAVPPAALDWLAAIARPRLRRSSIHDPLTGRAVEHPHRKSQSTNFGPTEADLVVTAVSRRIAHLTGTAFEAGEPLHILHYAPGDEFRPHHDAIEGAANPRAWTALLYLNGGYIGGETVFPALNIRFTGRPGDLLLWPNTDARGAELPVTRHAGEPVRAGEKWVATRWIRARPFDALTER